MSYQGEIVAKAEPLELDRISASLPQKVLVAFEIGGPL